MTSAHGIDRGTRALVRCACLGAALAALAVPRPTSAQGMVSGFEGSVERGVYVTEFGALATPDGAARDAAVKSAEGRLVSRVFTKPEAKSNLEVFRSYQQQLRAAGFTIRAAGEAGNTTELLARRLYSDHTPGFLDREYRASGAGVGRADLARLGTQAQYYLAASRGDGRREFWVAVVLCRYNNLYLVEELTTAAMDEGTVSIDLEQLTAAIASAGRIAIYDIHFKTGSAEIEPGSARALGVIAGYLKQTSEAFYIVGHTDDTGSFESNMSLSAARAEAVRNALVTGYGVNASRLASRGVGPLAPVSTNRDESGRSLNRRVEIVQRLGGR